VVFCLLYLLNTASIKQVLLLAIEILHHLKVQLLQV